MYYAHLKYYNDFEVSVMQRVYLCIDLKSFFASVECSVRKLDPFKVNLVVADPTRGQGALCLAITPKMKALGIKNRCRLFEIPKQVTYITAMPRMRLYMEYAAMIYGIYLKFVASSDIHIYSIDEAFLDITPYLNYYKMKPLAIAEMIIDEIYAKTHITATVGIGTNLYLAKIALDIIAKHSKDNIGILNESMYQKYLWHYHPITDFWHIGKGIANRLLKYQIDDMYGIAHHRQDELYQEFGINAEYLIDHAWGKEPTTIAEIKQYQPKHNSLSNSQILFEDYDYQSALLVLKEMVELNVLRLIKKQLVTDVIYLSVGYSKNIIPGTRGQRKLTVRTNSLKILMNEFIELFTLKTNKQYPIRQIGITFGDVVNEIYESYDLFTDIEEINEERNLELAIIKIKEKYGKNAIFKGMNKLDKATTLKRNTLIGGHNEK